MIKKEFQKFLEQNGFLPLSNWNFFEVFHDKILSPKDRKRLLKKIRENVEEKSGLYVYIYEQTNETLYVGEGKLFSRIKSHYDEFCGIGRDSNPNAKRWYAFFSLYPGAMKVYWKELKDTRLRKVIERMLSYVLNPKFERKE